MQQIKNICDNNNSKPVMQQWCFSMNSYNFLDRYLHLLLQLLALWPSPLSPFRFLLTYFFQSGYFLFKFLGDRQPAVYCWPKLVSGCIRKSVLLSGVDLLPCLISVDGGGFNHRNFCDFWTTEVSSCHSFFRSSLPSSFFVVTMKYLFNLGSILWMREQIADIWGFWMALATFWCNSLSE